jgi:hypothetical protein
VDGEGEGGFPELKDGGGGGGFLEKVEGGGAVREPVVNVEADDVERLMAVVDPGPNDRL